MTSWISSLLFLPLMPLVSNKPNSLGRSKSVHIYISQTDSLVTRLLHPNFSYEALTTFSQRFAREDKLRWPGSSPSVVRFDSLPPRACALILKWIEDSCEEGKVRKFDYDLKENIHHLIRLLEVAKWLEIPCLVDEPEKRRPVAVL